MLLLQTANPSKFNKHSFSLPTHYSYIPKQLLPEKLNSNFSEDSSVVHSAEAVAWRCSVKKKAFLEISQNSQENTCECNFIKNETPIQVFFCEFCEFFRIAF